LLSDPDLRIYPLKNAKIEARFRILAGVLSMFFLVTGITLLALIIGVFWLKDQLENPLLFRIAYSGLVARLAVVGATFIVLGLLLILADFAKHLSA